MGYRFAKINLSHWHKNNIGMVQKVKLIGYPMQLIYRFLLCACNIMNLNRKGELFKNGSETFRIKRGD
jgi:hypothetical protein